MSYSPSYIEPDMSNYYRLLRERSRRERVATAFPEWSAVMDDLCQNNAAITSFLQVVPTKNMGPEDDYQGHIQPGVMPRGINISNSITERKIFLRRIGEATLSGQEAFADRELARTQMTGFCEELGIDRELAENAAYEVTRAADNLKRVKTFQIVPGGLRP